MQLIVFEDRHVDRLFPITIGRLAYNISCGSYRLIDWIDLLAAQRRLTLCGVCRRYLNEIQTVDFARLAGASPNGAPSVLINARIVPSVKTFDALLQIIDMGKPGIVRHNDEVAVISLPANAPPPPASLEFEQFAAYLDRVTSLPLPQLSLELPMFAYPHDVVRSNMEILGESLSHRLSFGRYREIGPGVFAAEGAKLGQHCVSDTKDGPVLLDENASVGPYTYLSGPAYIGPRSRIIEHSAIKDKVAIGHTVKIGGEVEASVIEPYTNKQHHGFLGHSYLGSWINLGAGTSNSDLKNTYGQVKMEYRGQQVSTGMQFVGCVIGDYSKTAINTGIFTGKVIGACSMMYGFVTTNVPSFVNYARLFGQVTELTPEVMVATQQRMFSRRNVIQRPCDAQLIHHMYEITRHERQLAHEPLAL